LSIGQVVHISSHPKKRASQEKTPELDSNAAESGIAYIFSIKESQRKTEEEGTVVV